MGLRVEFFCRDYFGRWHNDTVVVNYPAINQLNDQIICIGNSITWDSNVSPALTTLWSTGFIGPSLNIDTAGFFAYELSDANGCSIGSDTIEVSLDSFSSIGTLGNDTTLCEGNLLSIYNQTAALSSVLWSSGSNSFQLPIFTAGTYSVQAINLNNCILNDTIVIAISGIAPQAFFSSSTVCEGSQVAFTDQSTPPAGNTITAWEWDFGNGNFSTLQNPFFTFPDSGVFNVGLKAITNTGCANNIVLPVEVISSPIVRNKNGLALSSRNGYFSSLEIPERINKILFECVENSHTIGVENALKKAKKQLSFLNGVDYLEVRSSQDLSPYDITQDLQNFRLFFAGKVNGVRLIDNISF
jgi:hypothetical protein